MTIPNIATLQQVSWNDMMMGIGIANCTGGNYPSSHNKMRVSPILVSFHLGWVSTSMIMGERVTPPTSLPRLLLGQNKKSWATSWATPTSSFDQRLSGNVGRHVFYPTFYHHFEEIREVVSPSSRSPSDLSPWKHSSGAHWDACDANGTCCLHVACRSGTLSIVRVKSSVHWFCRFNFDVVIWESLHHIYI